MAKTATLPSGWESVALCDVCSIASERTIDFSIENYISTDNMLQDFGGVVVASSLPTDKAIEYKKNDVLLSNIRQYLRKMWLAERTGGASTDVIVLRPKGVLPFYLFSLLKMDDFFSLLTSSAKGTKMPRGDKYNIMKYNFNLPPLAEQHRIAEILATQDSVITLKQRLIDTKKQQKRWLIQNLLTGRVRLSGVKGEWKRVKLGEIGDVCMCHRIFRDETAEIGEVPFYKIGTFGAEADAFITKKLFEEYKSKYSYPKNGEILISAAGTIGRTVVYNGESAYYQDSNIVWLHNDEKCVYNAFLYHLYQIINWAITTGGSVARLYNDNIKKTKIDLPTLPEQTAIAERLTTADKEIELLTQELEQQKLVKKYLMQQLLTGKIRVKGANVE